MSISKRTIVMLKAKRNIPLVSCRKAELHETQRAKFFLVNKKSSGMLDTMQSAIAFLEKGMPNLHR